MVNIRKGETISPDQLWLPLKKKIKRFRLFTYKDRLVLMSSILIMAQMFSYKYIMETIIIV